MPACELKIISIGLSKGMGRSSFGRDTLMGKVSVISARVSSTRSPFSIRHIVFLAFVAILFVYSLAANAVSDARYALVITLRISQRPSQENGMPII